MRVNSRGNTRVNTQHHTGDGPISTVTLKPDPQHASADASQCEGCQGKGCGLNLLDALFPNRRVFTLPASAIAPSTFPLTEGQRVELEINDRALLQLAMVGYGLPILSMVICVIGVVMAASVLSVDWPAFVTPASAAVGFLGGLFACRPLSNHLSARRFITLRGWLLPTQTTAVSRTKSL